MTFTEAERGYLATQRLARLATVSPSGKPQIVPVGFRLNSDHTIDIGGPTPTAARYRNVRANPNVSIVIDDMTPDDPSAVKPGWGRGMEIRGVAEVVTVEVAPVAPEWFCDEIIRIRPRRVRSWHIDPRNPQGGVRGVG
ncbi:PPOX class F420-dependent oxidoreductase [Nocardia sp. CDC159]|uniref:PPOX class F420-dependent oxidoreductase n=1 Tax=Nocardia pulmonis TaxID=2951408 RepID=A0A9X2IZY9_9NOCA|nr:MULTISPECIES: PPOX class F420-dependent oxidoreductase [Nocardia]MCM6776575.1 PPOX class F420-dependent oxidoreductase [Nocardia pulmonis]MCM6788999.1 PPOX class F420-dependent oxidoreductase [Nocardia sp. CDC159]